ncbi:MAG: flagellar basal-body rod protein FlgG [Aurantimonas coralicida]|jgi:flagellar basal-body rod protein FlgG|uniref:flagellar basal-body rod protein FlgG n=1 Tax=Aurantimonas TaxID=182269 RepID=UPI000416AF18|nr:MULTISPECIES: flagellar basal-body rod protein FlgG [Aurantimonas]MCW7542440.1 flagellar basal-body rod protein FlgG [Aurantimonas litoralis]MBC6716464.1 flagellar basal-body rod protein FlgG [Aurantimonas sp. DM33-3]MCC4297470.1 flagellar basal-body rod protein FlgG [Aurantimonas coralicida]MCD1641498.1 flagellar basal-body rod protein FlgG [Aurantimonas coralicida]MDE0921730.1 flagellar basal-body rod protein FlgG [Aurantimonas coralicida]
MRALAIAATGMNAQQTNVEVIANNIANINTTGFKRARAEFTDLLYQVERAQGVAARGGQGVVPEGAQLGLGTRLAAIRNLHIQGTLNQTGNKLDLALNGEGWFQVQGPGGEILYTRDGAFNTNGDGQLVTLDGLLVDPAITVPANTSEVIVNESGQVFARVGGAADLEELGQLTLATFANNAGLAAQGGNLFRETIASGAPTAGVPGDEGYATIQQGYLEDSNVDPVKEISELISAQRAYEMNSKVISAADEMASVVSKGIR